MRPRALMLVGLALLALFAAWLAVFTLGLPSRGNLPWWGLACAGSVAGLVWLAARPEAGTRAVALALAAHAALRIHFVLGGDVLTAAGSLELALALALLAATYASGRRKEWLPLALVACAAVVAAFLLRNLAREQGEAALRQAVQLAGFVALWLAVRRASSTPLENA
jgi:hypothetical protein